MTIYTKTGDQGDTKLFGGQKVRKNNKRIQAYGNVDELNAFLGAALAHINESSLQGLLIAIQKELFILGADLATPLESTKHNVPRISENLVVRLEEEIDKYQLTLPPLNQFILPNGSLAAVFLHIARTVARRTERSVVALMEEEMINGTALKYLNRLSDLFFVLAREANSQAGIPEIHPS